MEDLGLKGLDSTRESKAPAYRRNRRMKETLEVLKKTLGNVSAACERVGISRATFYLWRQNNAEFDQAVREINERTLDFVESKLMAGIEDGNPKLIMFFLANKGRSRGYSEKPDDAQNRRAINIRISEDEAEF